MNGERMTCLTINRVLDLAVLERDRIDGVVATSANATNGQTVTSGADTATESDVLYKQSVPGSKEEFFILHVPFQSSQPHNHPGYTPRHQ